MSQGLLTCEVSLRLHEATVRVYCWGSFMRCYVGLNGFFLWFCVFSYARCKEPGLSWARFRDRMSQSRLSPASLRKADAACLLQHFRKAALCRILCFGICAVGFFALCVLCVGSALPGNTQYVPASPARMRKQCQRPGQVRPPATPLPPGPSPKAPPKAPPLAPASAAPELPRSQQAGLRQHGEKVKPELRPT